MCVAVIVKGKSPTQGELLDMEINNPHGAGLAWADPDGRGVAYRKGLDAFQVYQLLQDMPRPALLHFRWATHGPKVPRLCHPFPLGPKALLSVTLEGTAQAVLIHNGVWSSYRRHAPAWAKLEEFSDTAVAAYVARDNPGILEDVSWATAVGRIGVGGVMEVSTTGGWKNHEGNEYSNLSWQPYKHTKAASFYQARKALDAKEDAESAYEEIDWESMVWDRQTRCYRFPPS